MAVIGRHHRVEARQAEQGGHDDHDHEAQGMHVAWCLPQPTDVVERGDSREEVCVPDGAVQR
jgi:hypothetical protein